MTLRSRRAAVGAGALAPVAAASRDDERRMTWTFGAQSPSFAGAVRRSAANSPCPFACRSRSFNS